MLFVADCYCGVGDCELLTYLLLKHFISRHVKVLLITAIIPMAFLETICICSTKVSPLSIIIPKSFSRLVHSIFTALPSQSDIVYTGGIRERPNDITLHLVGLNIKHQFLDHESNLLIYIWSCR